MLQSGIKFECNIPIAQHAYNMKKKSKMRKKYIREMKKREKGKAKLFSDKQDSLFSLLPRKFRG